MRVLDVACGPGRHAHALAARGIAVHGVDLSPRFVELARQDAPNQLCTFEVADARSLAYHHEFDVALSLCQGGLFLSEALDGMAAAATTAVAFTAFNGWFAVRHLEPTDHFDPDAGTNTERTTIKNEQGEEAEFVLTTEVFTPRELRLLCERAGLRVEHLWSVAPGAYAKDPPNLDSPEILVVAHPSPGSPW